MALTKFKAFMEQAPAKDYVPKKDGDEEAKGLEPRSKGERDFKAKHTIKKIDNPNATAQQFKAEEVEQVDESEGAGRADFKVGSSGRKIRKIVRFKTSDDAAEKERKEKGEE